MDDEELTEYEIVWWIYSISNSDDQCQKYARWSYLSARVREKLQVSCWQNASWTSITMKSTFLSHVWNKGFVSKKLNDFVNESLANSKTKQYTTDLWQEETHLQDMDSNMC